MFRGRLFFAAGYVSLLVHVLFCVNCCNSSSCGDIHDIRFPFRLKSDPVDKCGYQYVELECENNRTVLHLFSGTYYVQAISYDETYYASISLVDVGIQKNNFSSLPLLSLTPRNFSKRVGPIDYSIYPESFVALVSCEKPVKSPLYINTTSNISTAFCENKGGGGGGEGVRGSSSSKKHSYVLVGNHSLDWSDVANLCSVDLVFPIRFRLPDGRLIERNMTSLLEVHNALADGFDLSWRINDNEYCRLQPHCSSNYTQHYTAAVCRGHHRFWDFLDRFRIGDLSMAQPLVRKDDDRDDEAEYSLFLGIEKGAVLQEARVFNDPQLDARRCSQVITKLLYLLNQGETFTKVEATEVLFSVTKLFQSRDIGLRRMVYLIIKKLSPSVDEVIVVTSSLMKDMNSKTDMYRANAIRVLCQITDGTLLTQINRYLKQAIVDKNPVVASAALVSGIHLLQTNPEIVKRWSNEVQEAVQSRAALVQFHALALLHQGD